MEKQKSDDHVRERSESQQDDSEDESEVLEESPCGRWLKRREQVSSVYLLLYYCECITCLSVVMLSWRTG